MPDHRDGVQPDVLVGQLEVGAGAAGERRGGSLDLGLGPWAVEQPAPLEDPCLAFERGPVRRFPHQQPAARAGHGR
jgi:hypothetical protein